MSCIGVSFPLFTYHIAAIVSYSDLLPIFCPWLFGTPPTYDDSKIPVRGFSDNLLISAYDLYNSPRKKLQQRAEYGLLTNLVKTESYPPMMIYMSWTKQEPHDQPLQRRWKSPKNTPLAPAYQVFHVGGLESVGVNRTQFTKDAHNLVGSIGFPSLGSQSTEPVMI
ncbi:hypothetical protein VNO77_15017 [Canavalia gladiata]|uniref:Uncharacterized protein n=1 Tax=Canavalia gladiata TaxID=3824 RepID=A0AAN9M3Y4_CANGL